MKNILFILALLISFNSFGQTNEAIKFYNSAGKLYNKLASYEGCGTELECNKIYNESFSNYSKAIELSPNYERAYYFRALLQHNFGQDFYGSISDLTRAIELNPNKADYPQLRALSKRNLNDYNGSIEDYTKAIKLDPLNPWNWNGRAEMRDKINYIEGALNDYNVAVEVGLYYNKEYDESYDYTKDILVNRALFLNRISKPIDACKDVKRAISLGYEISSYSKEDSPIRILFSKCK